MVYTVIRKSFTECWTF